MGIVKSQHNCKQDINLTFTSHARYTHFIRYKLIKSINDFAEVLALKSTSYPRNNIFKSIKAFSCKTHT